MTLELSSGVAIVLIVAIASIIALAIFAAKN